MIPRPVPCRIQRPCRRPRTVPTLGSEPRRRRPGMFALPAITAGLSLVVLEATALAAPQVSAAQHKISLFKFLIKDGGPITWCILIPLSFVMVALIVEHSISIRRARILPEGVWRHIKALINQRRYRDAALWTADEPSTLSHVVHAALGEAPRGFAAMQRVAEESLEAQVANLIRKTEYLHVIGSVSPMIGLFGTVLGMMLAFDKLVEQSAGGTVDPAQLAYGIRTALVTTFWGLLIAIPALAASAIFRNRIDRLAAECLLAVQDLLTAFQPDPAQATAPPTPSAAARSAGPVREAPRPR